MKKFPINKKVTMIPYFLGFPLRIGYSFIGISAFLILVLLFTGFSLKKLSVIAGLILFVYLLFTVLTLSKVGNLEKRFFSTRLKAIKNNSLEPFKDGGHNK